MSLPDKQYVVILEPNSSGVLLISAAVKLGLHPIVITYNKDDRCVPEHVLGQASIVIEADTHNEQQLQEIILAYAQRVKIVAILPGFEYFVTMAARLSAHMGLRGLPIDFVDCLRVKSKMRACLKQQDVAIPRYALIHSRADIDSVANEVGFPCVIKPVNASGSIHVSKVNNHQQLTTAYHELCQDNDLDLGLNIGHVAIVEEYIAGQEFSVEGYVESGVIHFISITEKILSPEPYFVEHGHIVSPDMDEATRLQIYHYTEKVIKALNITLGVFHAELRLSQAQGPLLMEIAARLPGDNICELIAYAYDIHLAEVMIKNYVGIPVSSPENIQKQYAAIQFYMCEQSGFFQEVLGLKEVEKLPGFKRFELLAKAGQLLTNPNNSLGRIAKAIFTAPKYADLQHTMDQSKKLLAFA